MPILASLIAGGAIITPVIVVLLRSFTTGKLGAAIGFSAENYQRVFADQQIWSLLNNSILYAAGSAALGLCR